jgi:hypothetical protein
LVASHACGNGKTKLSDKACFNLFCIFWESNLNNNNRKTCHETFAELAKTGADATEMTCICIPGHTMPYTPGHFHQTYTELKDAVIERFDKNKDALNRYPYPACNGKEIVKIRSLEYCFSTKTMSKLAAHMKVVHHVVLKV